jgi:hypothetical protein
MNLLVPDYAGNDGKDTHRDRRAEFDPEANSLVEAWT